MAGNNCDPSWTQTFAVFEPATLAAGFQRYAGGRRVACLWFSAEIWGAADVTAAAIARVPEARLAISLKVLNIRVDIPFKWEARLQEMEVLPAFRNSMRGCLGWVLGGGILLRGLRLEGEKVV